MRSSAEVYPTSPEVDGGAATVPILKAGEIFWLFSLTSVPFLSFFIPSHPEVTCRPGSSIPARTRKGRDSGVIPSRGVMVRSRVVLADDARLDFRFARSRRRSVGFRFVHCGMALPISDRVSLG